MKNYTSAIFLLFGILSACSSESTFDDYMRVQIKYRKKKIESSEMGYSLVVPHSWTVTQNYDSQFLIETFMDSINHTNDLPFLSIAKFKGNSNDLDSYVDYLKNEEKLPEGFTKLSCGETEYLNYKSHYTHAVSTGDKNKVEVITFIVKAKEDSTFFTIMSSVPKNEDVTTNMAILMQCSKQFRLN